MTELLFIFVPLLPVAWVFGYLKGRKSLKENRFNTSSDFSEQYFKGLNYLLNEQSDKAIDTFVKMLEVDSETVETHLALGNLFRRRGEGDKAIRIHQNLIARPSLTAAHRKQALLELGYDYMAAGLFDRAENIFKELMLDPRYKNDSLKQLLSIYQQTKDWEQAIATSEQLQLSDMGAMKGDIAHFYCELAEQAIRTNHMRAAQNYLKKAVAIDPQCVRATLLKARLNIDAGRYRQAIKTFKELLSQDVGFLTEALPDIERCFDNIQDSKAKVQFLQEALERGAGASIVVSLAETLQKLQGDYQAAEFIAAQLKHHPSIKGLLKLIELHIAHASESARPGLVMLEDIVKKLVANKPVYRCIQCGFDSKSLFWQCPGCKSWGSVKPIQGIEGE